MSAVQRCHQCFQTIKFLDFPGSMNTEVSAVDTGVVELKSSTQKLQDQVDDIQKRLEQ